DWWGDYVNKPSAANIELFEGTNIVKSRSVSNQFMFTSGDLATGETDSYVYALGGNWDIGNNLKVKSELTYQESEFSTEFVGMRFDKGGYQLDVDFNAGGGLPAYSFPDNPATADVDESDLTDMVAWNSAQFYDSGTRSEGDATTFTIDATYTSDFSVFTAFDFGVRIDNRNASEANRRQGVRNAAITDYDSYDLIDGAYNGVLPIESMEGLASINSGFFDGQANVPTTWAAADGHYLKNNISDLRTAYGLSQLPLVNGFDIEELTTSAYVTAKFETDLAGRQLDGEFGLRYTSSDTDMVFTDIDKVLKNPTANNSSSASADTSKVLPSLMIRYHWTDDLTSRFSYTETLRRPAFNQLNANITYNEDVTNVGYGTAFGGNPDLAPTKSKNYDFSLEWYFAEGSSLYGTLFQRDIEGFVIDFRRQVQREKPNGEMGTYVMSQP